MNLTAVSVLVVAATLSVVAAVRPGSAESPHGVWMVDGEAAVQLFDCQGMLCGRIVWLQVPENPEGQLKVDKLNPDPALRQRELCGLDVISNLRPVGDDHWEAGRFYNPDSGKTYDVKLEVASSDRAVARFYQGSTILGETKTLSRIPRGTSKGWC